MGGFRGRVNGAGGADHGPRSRPKAHSQPSRSAHLAASSSARNRAASRSISSRERLIPTRSVACASCSRSSAARAPSSSFAAAPTDASISARAFRSSSSADLPSANEASWDERVRGRATTGRPAPLVARRGTGRDGAASGGECPPGSVQLPAQLLALSTQRVELVVARLALGSAVRELLLEHRHLALALADDERRRLLERQQRTCHLRGDVGGRR